MKYKAVAIPFIAMGVVCSLLFLGTGSSAFAQQVSRVVAVSVGEINGTAEILSREDARQQQGKPQILGTLWKPATSKASIRVGDQLRTGVDSSMKLHLNDGTVFTLSGDSSMVVEELKSAQGTIPRTATFFLEKGTISTQQTTKILGQTTQVIRTENGSVEAGMGEVEVYRPAQEYPRLAAALPYQWPLFAQESTSNMNRTFVIHKIGTSTTRAEGVGSITTSSLLLPDTCIGDDGVQFTLISKGAEVQLSKLVEKNGFHFKANRPVHVLTVTEDQATGIMIRNISGDAETDIEGISIVQQGADSAVRLGVNSLLTVGITATDAEVQFSCQEEDPEGLNYKIYGTNGNVVLLRDVPTGDSRVASRGNLIRSTPTPIMPIIPTATPTPEATATPEPDITPTPTSTPTPTPTGGFEPLPPEGDVGPIVPPSSPVTHTFSPNPNLTTTNATSTLNGAGCPGANNYRIDVTSNIENFLPTLSGGNLRSWITDQNWSPIGVVQEGPVNNYMTAYNYVAPHQETATVQYAFCYTPFAIIPPANSIYFRLQVWDSYGNASNVKSCSGLVTGGAITCP